MESIGYKAKKELEKIIYEDSGIYRFKQYKKAKSIQFLTAYDEIKIFWDQEIKYRYGFSVEKETVNMPVIFAKVNGVPGNGGFFDNYRYWKEVKELMTENAIVYKNSIGIKTGFFEKFRIAWNGFLNKGKLDIEKFRFSKFFKHYTLPHYLREHILEKLKYIVDNDVLKGTTSKDVDLDVLAIASKIPRNVIKKLNEFDFTKRNPKVILITTQERLLSVSEAIYLVLLYYIGFDVLIFAPNGISNIEYLLNKNIIQVHELGEYRANAKIPFFNLIF